MKGNFKTVTVLFVAMAALAATTLSAGESTQVKSIKKELAAVAPLDLPVKSASVVANAEAKHQITTTINVVKAAVALNPSAVTMVVGAVSREVPAMAATAATTAAVLLPKQAILIAKAAAAAAPAKAGQIASMMCDRFPQLRQSILLALVEVVPSAKDQILAANLENQNQFAPKVASPKGSDEPKAPRILDTPYTPLLTVPTVVTPGQTQNVTQRYSTP